MSKNEANSFILYNSFWSVFALLSMKQRGELVTAIFEYERLGHLTTELSPILEIAFAGIKDTLQRDRAAYAEKCVKNAENGKKGGRPKKTPTEASTVKTERFFEKPKKPYNDNENGNENENYNDIDNGNGNGIYIPVDSAQDNQPPSEQDRGLPPISDLSDLSDLSARSAPEAAPRLDSEDKARLISFGLTHEYIKAREKRAISYAKKNGASVYDVLISWWQADVKQKRTQLSPAPHVEQKSVYAEEWLNALINEQMSRS